MKHKWKGYVFDNTGPKDDQNIILAVEYAMNHPHEESEKHIENLLLAIDRLDDLLQNALDHLREIGEYE